jgi:DNA polymerase-1
VEPEFKRARRDDRASSDAQQFPQKGGIRECFVRGPGFVYCSVDYGGLELRTMSQRAIWVVGYSKMAEALNTGMDCHTSSPRSSSTTYEELLR